jgi:bacillolysin
MNARRCRLFATGLIASLAAAAGASAASPDSATARSLAAGELRAALGASGAVRFDERTGLVRFSAAAPGESVAVRGESPAERARNFLQRYAPAFGLRGVEGELDVVRSAPKDAAGIEVVRLRQLVAGIPVTGAEATVAVRGAGVLAAHTRFVTDLGAVALEPRIAADEVVTRLGARNERWQWGEDVDWGRPRLEIFSRPHLGGADFPARLAWFVEARRIDLRQFLWVDAESGIVLHRFSQLTDAKNRMVYDGNNAAALPGTLKRSEGGAATLDADEDAAYDYSGHTYDYFSSQHGRDSYDGAGAALLSTVDHCPSPGNCPMANAFWNGIQMVYGDGFAAADDVAAHELTHAVTEHTAGLFYYMQSGALNESYSDVFGETVDLINGAGNDAAGVRWLLGEDVPVFGAIRDMESPNAFNNPAKMSDPMFRCENYAIYQDAGGVHYNSGVPNKAYSLLVDGGTFNTKTVTGIGLTKAGKIWYRALANYLISSSDFADADAALRQSCTELIGTAGIVAGDCTELGDALDAVEMNDGWPCAPAQPAAPDLCPAGQSAGAFLFREDVEDPSKVASDWTVTGTNGIWANQPFDLGPFASSGTESFWGFNTDAGAADSSRAMAKDVKVVYGDTRAAFMHSFGFEFDTSYNYDGGRVERSTNGGSAWTDSGALIDAGAAYNGNIAVGFGSPLAGSSAFVKYSHGYTGSRLNLASLAGSKVRLRFRLASDPLYADYGWFVDDVLIYRCFPDTLIFADGFEVGDRTEWSLSNP